MAKDVFVVMGAVVREDGTPSAALIRRTEAALLLGQASPGAVYLTSGGPRGRAPAEAQVAAQLLLDAGVEPENIVTEERSRDTLESVRACVEILRHMPDVGRVVVCSDRFHLPRCRLLFRLLGISTQNVAMPKTMGQPRSWKALYFQLREAAALPWDTVLVLAARLPGRNDGSRLI